MVGGALVLGACAGPAPPAARYTGDNPKADIALQTAARDLGCPLQELRVIAESRRRYLNEASFRWVIEGCGERAGYFEQCDLVEEPLPPGWTSTGGSLACRDILMTRMRIGPASAPASLIADAGLVEGPASSAGP